MAESERVDFDKLWNYADPAGTEAQFRALLPAAEASGNADYLAQLLTQIARAQGLQDRFAEAHATLDQVIRMFGYHVPPVVETRYLLERGRLCNSADDGEAAMQWLIDAELVAAEHGLTGYRIDAMHMIAIVHPETEHQVLWNLDAIELALADPSQHGWLHALYNNLGESYARLGQYEDALDAFRKMAELDTSKGNEPEIYTLKDQSRVLRALGRFEEALAIIEPIALRLDAEKKRDGWISEEYAECLLLAGRADEAKPHFALADELLKNDPWVLKHEPLKLDRLRRLAPSADADRP